MNLILTMAGKYSRFKEAGFGIPKYLLPWGDSSVLKRILINLTGFYDFKNVILVANKSDSDFMPHVQQIIKSRLLNGELVVIDDTSGQAETVDKALSIFGKQLDGCPLIIHNIDTILYERDFNDIEKDLKNHDGFVDVFKASNHEYSYAVIKDNLVSVIAEKVIVSDTATTGLYGFSSPSVFKKYYDGEIYISDIYKKMILDNKTVVASFVHNESDTIVLGTPSDYIKRSQEI